MRLWLTLSSLEAVNASLAQVQRSLVSLTNAVTSAAPQQSVENDDAPPQQQSRHRHESPSMADLTAHPSTTLVAPIQVIRNMNYWITGRRPDGKTETTVRDDAHVVALEVSWEWERSYIRA
jgi:hypothetical protein